MKCKNCGREYNECNGTCVDINGVNMNNPIKWTNDSLDKHLQKRGFIKEPVIWMENKNYTKYKYNRLGEVMYATFTKDGSEPWLHDNMKIIDPLSIGYRNTDIQNDGSSDE